MADKWIQGAIKHPGALRRELHIKEGRKIPGSRLVKASHSTNAAERKRAILALTLRRLRKGKGKK